MPETVTITALGHSGDGITDTPDGPLYVPLTLPGETVEIDRQGSRGRLIAVTVASPDRVAPVCRHFGVCGTCAVEHMARPAYLAWKRSLVTAAFAQRGIEAPVEAVAPIGLGSRRRAILSAVRTPGGIALGFHRRGRQDIVPIEECPVLARAIVGKLPVLREIARMLLRSGKPARMVVLATDNGLDVSLDGAAKLNRGMQESLGRLAADPALARLTVDGTEIFRNRLPELKAGTTTLFPVAGGFVQAASAAENALAEAVLAHVGKSSPVADLFCGIGTFTLRLAARAAVTAVEGEARLLGALDTAVRQNRGLKPITLRKRDLFQNPLAAVELDPFGAVVFDPPAAGAKAQAEALAGSRVRKVIAVSCNPATLARDARILIDGGYRLDRVLPVDQFLFSAEIETVATFSRP